MYMLVPTLPSSGTIIRGARYRSLVLVFLLLPLTAVFSSIYEYCMSHLVYYIIIGTLYTIKSSGYILDLEYWKESNFCARSFFWELETPRSVYFRMRSFLLGRVKNMTIICGTVARYILQANTIVFDELDCNIWINSLSFEINPRRFILYNCYRHLTCN
jgi:hypothetical protein